MEHIKYCRNINTENTQNKRDTDIRGSPSLGYVHLEQPVLPFLLSNKMKRHNLQQIRCNILCFLSQSRLSVSRSQNTHLSIIASNTMPSYKEGVAF